MKKKRGERCEPSQGLTHRLQDGGEKGRQVKEER